MLGPRMQEAVNRLNGAMKLFKGERLRLIKWGLEMKIKKGYEEGCVAQEGPIECG